MNHCVMHHVCSREFAAELESVIELFVFGMPGRGKRVNSTAKTVIYNVYKYFQRESTKSKYRGPPKSTHKTAEATGYGDRTVRRIVSEKSLHQLSSTRWIQRR